MEGEKPSSFLSPRLRFQRIPAFGTKAGRRRRRPTLRKLDTFGSHPASFLWVPCLCVVLRCSALLPAKATEFCRGCSPPFLSTSIVLYPTNNALLINFRLRSDAEILLPSTDGACKSAPKRAKTRMQRVLIPTELPFCIPPLVVGLAFGKRRNFLSRYFSGGKKSVSTYFTFFFLLFSDLGGRKCENIARSTTAIYFKPLLKYQQIFKQKKVLDLKRRS